MRGVPSNTMQILKDLLPEVPVKRRRDTYLCGCGERMWTMSHGAQGFLGTAGVLGGQVQSLVGVDE